MRWLRYRGLMVIVLWQAPIGVVQSENGRTRLAFGLGGGRFEHATFDCAGDLVDASPVGFTTGGAAIEHWVEPRLRVSAHAGAIRDDSAMYSGGFGGVQFAYEGRGFGIGSGATRIPDVGAAVTLPNFYLRFGGLDGGHFRMDVLPPEPAFGATGLVRMGIGFNRGAERDVGGFVGLSICGFECSTALAVDVEVPVTSRFALQGGALLGPGHRYSNASAFLGGQVDLGRRPLSAGRQR